MIALISRLRTATPAFVLVSILFLAFVGFSPVAVVGVDESLVGTQSSEGDPTRQLGFALCFLAISAYVAIFQGKKALLDVPLPFVVLLAWCWASLFWAVSPDIAFRRLNLTTIVILSVSYCINNLSFGAAIRALCGFFAVVLVADWFAVAVFRFAIHQASEIESDLAGNWRGFHSHKNEAGSFCAIATIVFVYEARRTRSRVTGPILVALALGFLYLSQSKTSAGFVFVAMLIGACAKWGHGKIGLLGGVAATALVAVLVVIGLVPQSLDSVAALLNDPGSFTGRSQIWPVMLRYAADHPLLGSGYGSFWSIGPASPVFEYGAGWIHQVFEAHDGYLDILAQIGSIGLTIVVIGLILWPAHILFARPLMGDASRWLLASVLSFGWLRDSLESSLADRANPTWIVLVVMYCLLFKAAEPSATLTFLDPPRLRRS